MSTARVRLHIPSERRLFDSLEVACRRELLKTGFNLDKIGNTEWGDALSAYCRVLHRSIEEKPRAVKRSRELGAQLEVEQNQELIARVQIVEQEMREGRELNMRLSRKYYDAAYNDPLLNDLGVHHFHLGERAPSPKKLCKSFDHDLLFGVVERETIYLAHLGDHASFRKIVFEQIMFDNWPHLFDELEGLSPGIDPWPAEDRAKARHCGLSMMVQFDGKVYMPRWSGQSTAGTSIWVNNRINDLIHQVQEGRKWLLERSDWIIESMVKQGQTDRTLALEVEVAGHAVWFVDRVNQVWMWPSKGELRFRQIPAFESFAT